MGLLRRKSLAATLDAVDGALFDQRPLTGGRREEVARWIAGRQGLAGAYAHMFAPTAADFEGGIRLFTGESVGSRAGTAHILGEEACRALILLDVPSTRRALERASEGLAARLAAAHGSRPAGMFCCGTCSVALWRHLAAGGLDHGERRLAAGLEALRKHRDGRGRWADFWNDEGTPGTLPSST